MYKYFLLFSSIQANLMGDHTFKVGSTLLKVAVREAEDTTHQGRHPASFEFSTEHIKRESESFHEFMKMKVLKFMGV